MRFSRSCMRFFRPRLSISITPSVFGIGLPCAVSRDSLTIGSTQAVVEEPYACRANCRLRRSLVALTVHSRSGVSFIAEKPSSGLTRRRHVRASGMRGGYTAGRTGTTVHTPVNLSTHFKWFGPLPNFKIGIVHKSQCQFNVKFGLYNSAQCSSWPIMCSMTT